MKSFLVEILKDPETPIEMKIVSGLFGVILVTLTAFLVGLVVQVGIVLLGG